MKPYITPPSKDMVDKQTEMDYTSRAMKVKSLDITKIKPKRTIKCLSLIDHVQLNFDLNIC